MAIHDSDLEAYLAVIGGDNNTWGVKINNILLNIIQPKINELVEQANYVDKEIYGGSASSVYLTNQNLNGGGA